MKVAGQLENAGFEQLAADPAVSPTGRAYANIATPSAAVIKYFDGTAWRTLQNSTTLTVFSQNSGLACTVDWSKGLNQEVILTNNCLISFTNPQIGQNHRLIVTQKTYTSAKNIFQFRLNMIDQDPNRGSYQPQSIIPFSDNKVYNWLYSPGIRAGYATVPAALSNPVTNVGEAVSGIDFSPDGKSLFMGRVSTPFVANQQFFDAGSRAFIASLNTITAPTAAAAKVIGTRFCPDQNLGFTIGGTTPFLQCWPVVDSKIIGGAYPSPVTVPTGAGQCLDVHPNGNFVIAGHTTTPFMSAYPFDQAGFGTKLTNPVTLPVAQVNGVAFSPMGDFVAAVGATTPFIQVWPFDPIAGAFGAVIANPTNLPPAGPAASLGNTLAWRPQGDYIAMSVSGSTTQVCVLGFNRVTGAFTGTTLTDIALGAINGTCVRWTPDGQYLLVGMATAPFLRVYDFSANTLGTFLTFDLAAPTAVVNDMIVDPSGRYLVLALNTTPFIQGFLLPTKVRNYLRVTP